MSEEEHEKGRLLEEFFRELVREFEEFLEGRHRHHPPGPREVIILTSLS